MVKSTMTETVLSWGHGGTAINRLTVVDAAMTRIGVGSQLVMSTPIAPSSWCHEGKSTDRKCRAMHCFVEDHANQCRLLPQHQLIDWRALRTTVRGKLQVPPHPSPATHQVLTVTKGEFQSWQCEFFWAEKSSPRLNCTNYRCLWRDNNWRNAK